jgi:crotonobetainyl-CoA:carnitine CoA-transferase CaiB-like acyl-CoA transferase
MAELDSGEWAQRFDELGVPYAPVQTRAEWAASATVAANDLLLPVPGHDATIGPGLPAVLSATPGSLEPSDASGAGPSRAAVPAVSGARALPLDGVLVVDATKFLAGPFGGLVLQDLGARVVKVDPPGGEDFRTVAAASYCALNRDKDQVCIDLKDAAGRDAFTALVHRADALVENMSRQVVDELGLDVGAFRAGNPGLVHCHVDGWGAGPLEDTPGFDPLLQARSGLLVAQGGADSPVIQPMSVHDIGTGTLAAFGTLTALYARTHLGAGQDVRVALSRTSVVFQGAEFTTYPGRPAPRTGYIDYVGDGPAHRYVEAGDGWLAVYASTDAQRAAWDGVRGVDDAALAELTVDTVVEACRAADVPAIAVLSRDDVYTDTVLAENDCFLTVDDDDLGEVRVIRGYSGWDGVPPRRRAVMHAAGRDTDAVLKPGD